MDDFLRYPDMIEDAMRGMVRDALSRVAANGLPGQHHFYVSFRTDRPDTDIPASLRERYPEELTIVLQHQFWDLEVADDRFSVTLTFGGQPSRLVVPFAALTGFADPSVEFALQFQAPAATADARDAPSSGAGATGAEAVEPAEGGESEKVVTLDAFRRK